MFTYSSPFSSLFLSLSLSLCVSDVGDFVKEDEVIAEIETDKVME